MKNFMFLKHYVGHRYFLDAIEIAKDNNDALTAITKEIYIPIAQRYHTTWNCVERNIRTLCKYIWENGGRTEMEKLGYDDIVSVPKNRECIELIVTISAIVDEAELYRFLQKDENTSRR